MTAYFDAHHSMVADLARQIAEVGEDGAYAARLHEKLDAAEAALVHDVTLCAEWPGCPADIRNAIHKIVLVYAMQAQPSGVEPPDYAGLAAYARGLEDMGSHLHTIYHALARRDLERFSDDPRCPVRCLLADGDARREGMCPPPIRFWRAQLQDMLPEERAPIVEAVAQRAYDYARFTGADEAAAEKARQETVAALEKQPEGPSR